MKAFYKSIVSRILATSNLDHVSFTPLEAVICRENLQDEDSLRMHDHIFSLLLEEIAHRENMAMKYGEGEKDWVMNAFHSRLDYARKYGQPMDRAALHRMDLSPKEMRARISAQKNREAAAVYPLRRQGLSAKKTSAVLGISEQAVRQAEHRLISLYNGISNRMSMRRNINLEKDKTVLTGARLLACEYRVFCRSDTGLVQYGFYQKDRSLGTAAAQLLPDFPLVLQSNGLIFNSSFDPAQTIFSGISRTVVDADNSCDVAARLTWLGKGHHEMQLNWATGIETIQIRSDNDFHRFYAEGVLIAEIMPLPEKQSILGWDLSICMKAYREISDMTALLMMCYPVLRFAK